MFANRTEAGVKLAARLPRLAPGSTVVLALPRGGVPVGAEIARTHGLPLDLAMVRKVGLPGHSELAVAAIAGQDGEEMVINTEVARQSGIDRMTIKDLAEKERVELRRRQATYQGERPPVPVEGKTAILVDDGAATGATLLAAVRALRRRGPARVVLAVPVASVEALELLRPEVDEVLCLEVPQPFCAVGESYGTFPQVSDSQVLAILAAHPIPNAPPPTGHQTGPKGGEP